MKKITLSSIIAGITLLPAMAFAISAETPPGQTSIQSIGTLVGKIEQFMWIIFGGLAVIMFVVAGIMFLTAQGDPEKVTAARGAFIWGIAGVVVGIVAYSIVSIVGIAMGV